MDYKQMSAIDVPQIANVHSINTPTATKNSVFDNWDSRQLESNLLNAAQQKEQNTREKLDLYTYRYLQRNKDGAIDQAKISGMFPEANDFLKMQISEAVGEFKAAQQFNQTIEEVGASDELRLNADKRNAYINMQQNLLMNQIGGDNEFARAGVLKATNRLVNQYTQNWNTEASKHKNDLQKFTLAGDVADLAATNTITPDAINAIIKKWDNVSTLNINTINNTIVDALYTKAIETNNADLLDSVDPNSLDLDSRIKLTTRKQSVNDAILNKIVSTNRIQKEKDDADYLALQTDILDKIANNSLDPNTYIGNPKAHAFALKEQNRAKINAVTSVSNKNLLKHDLLVNATFNPSSVGGMNDTILNATDINSEDKVALLNDMENIQRGIVVMRDPIVTSAKNASIRPLISNVMANKLLRLDAMEQVDFEQQYTSKWLALVVQGTQAYYSKNNDYPNGIELAKIVNESVEVLKAELAAVVAGETPADAVP